MGKVSPESSTRPFVSGARAVVTTAPSAGGTLLVRAPTGHTTSLPP